MTVPGLLCELRDRYPSPPWSDCAVSILACSRAGLLIVDDYGFDNCRAAVEGYRRENGISEPIARIDWVRALWRTRAHGSGRRSGWIAGWARLHCGCTRLGPVGNRGGVRGAIAPGALGDHAG